MLIGWCVTEWQSKAAIQRDHIGVLPSGVIPAGEPNQVRPYEDSSRMKGNFHVRFLGGRGRATARAYPG